KWHSAIVKRSDGRLEFTASAGLDDKDVIRRLAYELVNVYGNEMYISTSLVERIPSLVIVTVSSDPLRIPSSDEMRDFADWSVQHVLQPGQLLEWKFSSEDVL